MEKWNYKAKANVITITLKFEKAPLDVTVWSNSTVAEAVSECLLQIDAVIAGTPSAPVTAPQAVSLAGPLPAPLAAPLIASSVSPAVLLFMGGSRAPVDARAPAAALEGEVLVLEYEPPPWDGKDLEVFIAWEQIYASTLFSAVELYGKPLARAGAISKEEYHLLFYYLQSVSEASEALAERMRKYIDSGLLINEGRKRNEEKQSIYSDNSLSEEEPKSILSELVLEGVLSQRDVDAASVLTGSECTARSHRPLVHCDSDTRSSVVSASAPVRRTPPRTPPEISLDCGESILDGSVLDDDDGSVAPAAGNSHCCTDHRISADVTENVWANMTWNFLDPKDFGYDQIRSVKRSRSDSALTPVTGRRNEDVYERLPGVDGESCGSITPYESIEDLYDCIKNGQYCSAAAEESTPSTESRSEPRFPDYSDKASVALHSSTGSDKSAVSSVFPLSKCGSSDSASASVFCESTSGAFAAKITAEALQARALPQPPIAEDGAASESTILLRQLFMGELMDAYAEFLAAYPHARALLRRKQRRDEHFAALADIRRGAAKLHIVDYLELPVSTLFDADAGRGERSRASDLSGGAPDRFTRRSSIRLIAAGYNDPRDTAHARSFNANEPEDCTCALASRTLSLPFGLEFFKFYEAISLNLSTEDVSGTTEPQHQFSLVQAHCVGRYIRDSDSIDWLARSVALFKYPDRARLKSDR
ncbi:hypothetical protein EVAR_95734_1 [Eumeta japonica]|uniref:Uncharacterized protein n=1 Tax=Eumeta variegata TaxID=151549 RepID=A0A4C1UKH2_EUMVA|nr:hypothetical protein EVAR_95734_1 [Eumeta japonica]